MADKAARGAVSVRRMRGPKVSSLAPKDWASAASSGAKPPSGPTNTKSLSPAARKAWRRLSSPRS